MTVRYRLESGKHPSIGTILLHMDGALDASESGAIAEHLSVCWACRVTRDKVQRGIDTFMEFRQDVLLTSVPPPPASPYIFRRRSREILSDIEKNSPLTFLRRFAFDVSASQRIAAGITAVVSAFILFFLVTLPVAHSPRLDAAELIQRARASSKNAVKLESATFAKAGRKVVYQKVQLRAGSRTIEREIVLAGGGVAASAPPPDAEWSRLLAYTPIDWSNPLGVDDYERWRQHEGRGEEVISESNGLATLSDVPTRRTLIASASLTVRELDWHPIAKQVNFVDREPIEVREIDYGIRSVPRQEDALVPAAPPVPAGELSREPESNGTIPVDLNEVEVQLRELLHGAGADMEEAPEVTRDGFLIRVRGSAEAFEGKSELLASIRALPQTVVEIFGVSGLSSLDSSPGVQQDADIQLYSTAPPLFKALQDFLGGVDNANTYLHAVRDSYRETLIPASALKRLADRYAGEWEKMQPSLRERIGRIAIDDTDKLRRRSDIYLKQLSRALDEMLNRSKVAAGSVAPASPCISWKTGADLSIDDLHGLETAFQRLFVVEITDQPIAAQPADALLLESADRRARFARDIGQFCIGDDVRQ